MRRSRLEERDLRSLDRRGLRSIFTPLDPNERHSSRPAPYLRGALFSRGEPRWRDGVGLLMFPLLALLITVELWAGVPQLLGWLGVLGFLVLFTVAALLIDRRP